MPDRIGWAMECGTWAPAACRGTAHFWRLRCQSPRGLADLRVDLSPPQVRRIASGKCLEHVHSERVCVSLLPARLSFVCLYRVRVKQGAAFPETYMAYPIARIPRRNLGKLKGSASKLTIRRVVMCTELGLGAVCAKKKKKKKEGPATGDYEKKKRKRRT
jgi:hypothetical protein